MSGAELQWAVGVGRKVVGKKSPYIRLQAKNLFGMNHLGQRASESVLSLVIRRSATLRHCT
jgi:hypothetical protein